ncbi:hypothetical protein [Mucilaginibacter sp.]|uniref:hypothetical protein n=1 Tax=Mucilaginibacter sp. TaxID=1882438 RepID=UPI0025F407B2|nr:hypothetical protein [Mucilaginibacter sp.]
MKQIRQVLPPQLIVFIGVFTCFCIDASAQVAFNCSKLLKQNIAVENQQDVLANFNKHADCLGLDSVDLRMYSDGPVLGTLLLGRIKAKGDEKITYGDISTFINNAKKDTGYTSVRNLVIAQMTLEKRRFTPDNWESSLKYLKVVGMPDADMEAFHKYLLEKQEHHWTYRQLIVGYQMKREAEAPAKGN